MSSFHRVIKLHSFDDKVLIEDKALLEHALLDGNLEFVGVHFRLLAVREQINEQIVEENHILGEEFR